MCVLLSLLSVGHNRCLVSLMQLYYRDPVFFKSLLSFCLSLSFFFFSFFFFWRLERRTKAEPPAELPQRHLCEAHKHWDGLTVRFPPRLSFPVFQKWWFVSGHGLSCDFAPFNQYHIKMAVIAAYLSRAKSFSVVVIRNSVVLVWSPSFPTWAEVSIDSFFSLPSGPAEVVSLFPHLLDRGVSLFPPSPGPRYGLPLLPPSGPAEVSSPSSPISRTEMSPSSPSPGQRCLPLPPSPGPRYLHGPRYRLPLPLPPGPAEVLSSFPHLLGWPRYGLPFPPLPGPAEVWSPFPPPPGPRYGLPLPPRPGPAEVSSPSSSHLLGRGSISLFPHVSHSSWALKPNLATGQDRSKWDVQYSL